MGDCGIEKEPQGTHHLNVLNQGSSNVSHLPLHRFVELCRWGPTIVYSAQHHKCMGPYRPVQTSVLQIIRLFFHLERLFPLLSHVDGDAFYRNT